MPARERRPPIEPPVAPMLGKLARELPRGDYVYEPKWDGFRCLAFRAGEHVELRSRNDRPLGRYFPERGSPERRRPGDAGRVRPSGRRRSGPARRGVRGKATGSRAAGLPGRRAAASHAGHGRRPGGLGLVAWRGRRRG